MMFSEIVYLGHGPHARPGGGFSTLGVYSEDEYEQALKDGWFKTLPEAIEAYDSPKENKPVAKVEEVKDGAPKAENILNRAELEAKARELGITFHHRLSDANLLTRINETIKE